MVTMQSQAAREQFQDPEDQSQLSEGHEEDDKSYAPSSASSATSDREKEETSKSLQEEISKRETVVVLRLRLLVLLVLVMTSVAVSLTIYFAACKSQQDEFESQYNGAAQKVVGSFEGIIRQMSAISGLSVQYSADSDSSKSWPFVTMDYFQQRAGNAKLLSGALSVSIAPVILPGYVPRWEEYTRTGNNSWIAEGHKFQQRIGVDDFEDEANIAKSIISPDDIVNPIFSFDKDGNAHEIENKRRLMLPVWQTSPVLKTRMVNEDLFTRPNVTGVVKRVIFNNVAVLGRFLLAPPGNVSSSNYMTAMFAALQSINEKKEVSYTGEPMAYLYFPIFNSFNETERATAAVMTSVIQWRSYFQNILPDNVNGIVVVLNNTCDGFFTYQLFGPEADVMGAGDMHDPRFDKYKVNAYVDVERFDDGTSSGVRVNQEDCKYSVQVYPTKQFYNVYVTNYPITLTVSISAVFLFTCFMFLFYDRLVERRQRIVLAKATQSTAIVSSLFPKNVRDRLMEAENKKDQELALGNKGRLKGFINGEAAGDGNGNDAAPIADLFPHCTVFFADIAGFTAWSSTREPAQVFILLQSVYQAFDVLAKRRKVFKVETIGDSYMAVTGLPEPMDNHATTMARFAADCHVRMYQVTKELECSLGPDTSELAVRIGLHSGPVTAGVLRGDRARFQLFGDTVNTASRMESTGVHGKIQITSQTAKLIEEAGKKHWVRPREDKVYAKGKGTMTTYWVQPDVKHGSSIASGSSDGSPTGPVCTHDMKSQKEKKSGSGVNTRLVEWMVDLLADDIKKLMYVRQQCGVKPSKDQLVYHPEEGKTCMDEVQDVIKMPDFSDELATVCTHSHTETTLGESVMESLRQYVTMIASMYRNNPFHNFEHACHVTMSVKKLLKRIVAPEISTQDLKELKREGNDIAEHLHDYTHGLHSDALGALAITWSALIHDVDHQGISNIQLGIENPAMAERYQNKSLAEQNSLDLAWDVLMLEQFSELRSFMFATEEEMLRFRQLIVNVVLATDIFDKELNDLRKSRWERAFSEQGKDEDGKEVDSDLRATIVIEHIIQASDVSHTMQHWHVYQKWNKLLFQELYAAYRAGRMAKDPATFWYNGEIGFFDNYIIPLAKKLEECGVFGVSSDEYLNYAVQNRAEWEARGQEIVKKLIKDTKAAYDWQSRGKVEEENA